MSPQAERQHKEQTAAIVAHGLLTSMAVVTAGVSTIWDHWADLPPEKRDYLFSRILAHASLVSDGLRDVARGLPEETLAELEEQQRHRHPLPGAPGQ
jgi:hypothetical protein